MSLDVRAHTHTHTQSLFKLNWGSVEAMSSLSPSKGDFFLFYLSCDFLKSLSMTQNTLAFPQKPLGLHSCTLCPLNPQNLWICYLTCKRVFADVIKNLETGWRWLMPILLATQEVEIRRIVVWSQARQIVHETLSWKALSQKIGLVEWLKMKALSSSPSTEKKIKVLERGRSLWIILVGLI
jgi:hypothetical protein